MSARQQILESSSSGGSYVRRWWRFICERFPLGSHGTMVACFTLGNAAFSTHYTGTALDLKQLLLTFFVTLLFFFRLRCFDEIKDYEVDLAVNPTRPLARGLLRVSDTQKMIAAVSVIELSLVACAGLKPLAVHGVAMAYSFLMYREFFIGRFLRPHLTTYAVTHTFVSMLVGWSIVAQVTGVDPTHFPTALWLLGPINWMLFNLFEFARKTFAREEERKHVESYSSLFGPWGAASLSLTQIAVALAVLAILPETAGVRSLTPLMSQVLLALFPMLAAFYYVVRPHRRAAAVFRNVTSVYLLAFYLLMTWNAWN